MAHQLKDREPRIHRAALYHRNLNHTARNRQRRIKPILPRARRPALLRHHAVLPTIPNPKNAPQSGSDARMRSRISTSKAMVMASSLTYSMCSLLAVMSAKLSKFWYGFVFDSRQVWPKGQMYPLISGEICPFASMYPVLLKCTGSKKPLQN